MKRVAMTAIAVAIGLFVLFVGTRGMTEVLRQEIGFGVDVVPGGTKPPRADEESTIGMLVVIGIAATGLVLYSARQWGHHVGLARGREEGRRDGLAAGMDHGMREGILLGARAERASRAGRTKLVRFQPCDTPASERQLHLVPKGRERDPRVWHCSACERVVVERANDPTKCPCGAGACERCLSRKREEAARAAS